MEDQVDAVPCIGFQWAMHEAMREARRIAEDHGFHTFDREDGTILMLMVSELSEALEGLRHGNPPSEHIPEFSAVEEELADLQIRLMDYAEAHHHRLPEAILAKMAFNEARPYQHGKQF